MFEHPNNSYYEQSGLYYTLNENRIPPTKEDADIFRKRFVKIMEESYDKNNGFYFTAIANAINDYVELKQ